MRERRKFLRFQALLDVFFKSPIGRGREKLQLTDLSKEGAKISGEVSMRKGSLVELEMQIPGDNMPVFANAEVAWTRKLAETSHNTGVKFVDIENSDKARLLDYVYNEWINSKKSEKKSHNKNGG